MYAQMERPKENKSRAVANSVAQKKSIGKQGFGFVDNRPEAFAQRKIRKMLDNSSRVKQLRVIQRNVEVRSGGFGANYVNLRLAYENGTDVAGANAGQAQTINNRLGNFFNGEFGLGGAFNVMNAHMIARSFGGDGANANNVKVWNRDFEDDIWTPLEQQVHATFRQVLNHPDDFNNFTGQDVNVEYNEPGTVTLRVTPVLGLPEWWAAISQEMQQRYQNGPGDNAEWHNQNNQNAWQTLERLVRANIPIDVTMEMITPQDSRIVNYIENRTFPQLELRPLEEMINVDEGAIGLFGFE